MISTQSGSIRLFRFAGIQVYLHWTWFLAAWYFIAQRSGAYASIGWNIAEYVTLFVIVLLHEFGHAFASRQVGGEAREIVLWPFGGIAFVKVPPRPGAELWGIAAGPLVNVALYPVLYGLLWLAQSQGWAAAQPEFAQYLVMIFLINKWLLIFNLLPIYPLDGGQIVRALLWFKLGRARSLQIATIIGFVGIALLLVRAVWIQSIFSGLIALFLAGECHRSYKHAQALAGLSRLPRHRGFKCPACLEAPPGGPMWGCASCGNRFDPFSTAGVCPHCQTPQAETLCPNCGTASPIARWSGGTRSGAPPVIDV